jgi:hypothetical protein
MSREEENMEESCPTSSTRLRFAGISAKAQHTFSHAFLTPPGHPNPLAHLSGVVERSAAELSTSARWGASSSVPEVQVGGVDIGFIN